MNLGFDSTLFIYFLKVTDTHPRLRWQEQCVSFTHSWVWWESTATVTNLRWTLRVWPTWQVREKNINLSTIFTIISASILICVYKCLCQLCSQCQRRYAAAAVSNTGSLCFFLMLPWRTSLWTLIQFITLSLDAGKPCCGSFHFLCFFWSSPCLNKNFLSFKQAWQRCYLLFYQSSSISLS